MAGSSPRPLPEGGRLVATSVTMPQLGETVVEGTITKWLKQEGENVDRDEPLFEISTDKVDTEVPSPLAGKIVQILVPEGETVAVGAQLAMIETAGDGQEPAPVPAAEAAPEAAPAEPPHPLARPRAAAHAGAGSAAPSRADPSYRGGSPRRRGRGGGDPAHPHAPGHRPQHGGLHPDLGPGMEPHGGQHGARRPDAGGRQ